MSSQSAGAPADDLVGTVLADRYRLHELLGEGGMGKVYAAEHVLMRKRLAVKVIHHELCAVPEVVLRFEREAMATANIDHPNIAAATDCGRLPDGSLFLVLELVQGKSLRDEIHKGAMPLSRALHIAQQIASALAGAQLLDIVHRDLKPENVMLIERGGDPDFVKVLDFGIAKLPPEQGGAVSSAPLTKAGVVFGTPEYMAPEQALGQNVDGRTDLYALGVITYEMICGARPFSADSDAGLLGQQLAMPVPPFAERAPGSQIPRQVELVVHKLLAKDAGSRFQTAGEVVEAFAELLRPTSPGAGARLFTLPDGSPTAFLGTAAQVYGPEAPVHTAPLAEQPLPAGPSGTLPMLDADRGRELAARVAAVSEDRTSRFVAQAREALGAVFSFIDDNRHRAPERIRRPLEGVPAAGIFGVLVLLVWGVQLIVLAWIVTAKPEPEPSGLVARGGSARAESPKPDPVLEELAAAKSKGHAALEKLAQSHPKHARVALELAASHSARSEHSAAVAALGRALSADAKLAEEQPATDVLVAAVRKQDAAEASFGLLEGPMGAAGAAVLYDLSFDQKVPATTRRRAQKWIVLSPEFTKVASPSVAVAAQLRYARSCSDRHSLMARAGDVGDQRALAYLEIARSRAGCGRRGKDDCFPCLRKDDALKNAIAAIKKRLAEKR